MAAVASIVESVVVESDWKVEEPPLIPTSMVPPKTHSIRLVHAALVVVQLGYAGLQMFSRVALDAGLNQFLLSMYRNMIAFAILGPLAYYFERDQRPPMSFKILGGLNLLALTGVVGSQQLFLAGLQLTSPLMAAVSQNMIPVFTFLLAATLGFEEVNVRRREGLAKVFGTTICIGGAITMSVYKGMALFGAPSDESDAGVTVQPLLHLAEYLHHDVAHFSVNPFHLGIFFLIMNGVSWAVYLTCQHRMLFSVEWRSSTSRSLSHIFPRSTNFRPEFRRVTVDMVCGSRDADVPSASEHDRSDLFLRVHSSGSFGGSQCWQAPFCRFPAHIYGADCGSFVCGSDCINVELAAPVVVRAEGRTVYRVFVCSDADGYGGCPVSFASQGYTLHGNSFGRFVDSSRILPGGVGTIRRATSETHCAGPDLGTFPRRLQSGYSALGSGSQGASPRLNESSPTNNNERIDTSNSTTVLSNLCINFALSQFSPFYLEINL